MRGAARVPRMYLPGFVSGGVGYIPLWGKDRIRAWALVDACDFMDVARFRWHLTDTGYACRWYGGRPPKRKRDRMHRRVLGLPNGDKRQADHLNRNRLDNRRCNLRIVLNDAQNKQNLGSNKRTTSPYRGVSWSVSRQRWVAQARCGDKYFMRRCLREDEARDAVMAWRSANMPFAVEDR